ncbi:hypothetical protein NCAS_0A08520 [Naumovozyma castellii]|uniref:Uncharacterized protein n=1 Tax=Naumovozyma castellii TaxID=27288 RepID=G0V7G2_NAUCA|nr:hypothetical protein NCAS_0A08520 [Naumovozyma castellii CBS 4309]CCC67410.1 hypothetical protein NCAS_0A08520 [Naumovozyma castellii CBS 4309]
MVKFSIFRRKIGKPILVSHTISLKKEGRRKVANLLRKRKCSNEKLFSANYTHPIFLTECKKENCKVYHQNNNQGGERINLFEPRTSSFFPSKLAGSKERSDYRDYYQSECDPRQVLSNIFKQVNVSVEQSNNKISHNSQVFDKAGSGLGEMDLSGLNSNVYEYMDALKVLGRRW